MLYSRYSAGEFRDWLVDHGCPGTLLTASSAEEAAAHIVDVDAILAWKFPVELFTRASRLRWVQSLGAGVEDLIAARSLPADVVITRIVDQFGSYIGEYVFAELLSRVRQLDRLRAGQRERHCEHFVAGTLEGQILGVAGLGSIGKEIIRTARAFDMRVHGLSRTGSGANLVDRHFTPDAWTEFVHELDVLVLSLPCTPQTDGVVNAPVLNAMRPESILVNVGRGALVDEAALIAALRDSSIAGAILDVFRQEPLPADSPLWTLPGVTVTPHVSGPSTVEGVGSFFLKNVHRFVEGKPLVGVVDRSAGY